MTAEKAVKHIPHDFVPTTPEEFEDCLQDPWWRLFSGQLYWILVKSENEDGSQGEGLRQRFKPNRAQRRFMKRMWHRNLILKARQLGFTTLVAIMWLDHALFVPDSRCGIVAQDRETAEAIFRDKVKFAYENLPPELKERMPLKRETTAELLFTHNNSSIRVATSVRGGTIHRLHVSEFGKICAKFPDKAAEVVTGSIPAVPLDGVLIIESTAEGREGEFYDMVQRAGAIADQGKTLTVRDYRLHFYPWHDEQKYRMSPVGVVISPKDHKYFDGLEQKLGKKIDLEQRAWYCATRDSDFSGKPERMWQEYPSTREEAFQQSTEGCYYTEQMARARREGRITSLPAIETVPCWTWWDIGNSDGTAIWVMQKVGNEYRCVRFYEEWGEPYSHAARWLQGLGLIFDKHYLPHDADHVRQGLHSNKSPRQMLEELMPGHRFEVVERIQDVNWGIQQTRDAFQLIWFDEEHCKTGIDHLDAYRKKWSQRQQCWSDEPDKAGGHSEAADALRQFGQAYASGIVQSYQTSVSRSRSKVGKRSWRAA